jgi:hypothetical protein
MRFSGRAATPLYSPPGLARPAAFLHALTRPERRHRLRNGAARPRAVPIQPAHHRRLQLPVYLDGYLVLRTATMATTAQGSQVTTLKRVQLPPDLDAVYHHEKTTEAE